MRSIIARHGLRILRARSTFEPRIIKHLPEFWLSRLSTLFQSCSAGDIIDIYWQTVWLKICSKHSSRCYLNVKITFEILFRGIITFWCHSSDRIVTVSKIIGTKQKVSTERLRSNIFFCVHCSFDDLDYEPRKININIFWSFSRLKTL